MRYKDLWKDYAPDNISILKVWFDSAMKFMNYKIELFGEQITFWEMLIYFTMVYLLLRFFFKLFR